MPRNRWLAFLVSALLEGSVTLALSVPATASPQPAPVVLVRSARTVEIASSAKSARVHDRRTYAILQPSDVADGLRSVSMLKSYEQHPVSAHVVVRSAKGVRLKKRLADFHDFPYLRDNSFVSDARSLSYGLPPFEPGDTLDVDLEFKLDPFLGLPVYIFGSEILPVEREEFAVEVSADLAPIFREWNGAGPPAEERKGGRILWSWSLGPLEPPPDEPLRPPAIDILPAVHVGTSRIAWGPSGTWEQLGRTYWNRISDTADRVPCDLAGRGSGDATDGLEQALDLIQNSIRYVSISLGPGGKVPHSSDETCRRKYGDCKDMSILMLSMLVSSGHEAGMALVQTRPPAGLHVDPLPTLNAFNHAVVCASVDSKDVWLDATDSYGTARTPRSDIQGSPALVVSGPRPGYRKIAMNSADLNRHHLTLDLEQQNAGVWKGAVAYTLTGSPAVRMARAVVDPDRRRRVMRAVLSFLQIPAGSMATALDSLQFSMPDFDSLTLSMHFALAVGPENTPEGGFRIPWNSDPWPMSALKQRDRVNDLYWPDMMTVTDEVTVRPLDAALDIEDDSWTGEAPGLAVSMTQSSQGGEWKFARTLRVFEPVLRVDEWGEGRELRTRSVRWASREIAATHGGGQ